MASSKPLLLSFVLTLALFFTFSEARVFLVGGRGSTWKVPSLPDDFNKWSSKTRFRIGDSIEFKYDPQADSVLEVTEQDYNTCNKAKPIKSYKDADTKIQLDRSGPFYFISGAEGHCEKGQKLLVRVLSAKHSHPQSPTLAPSPAYPLSPVPAPGPAPHNQGSKGGVVSLALVVLGCLVALSLG